MVFAFSNSSEDRTSWSALTALLILAGVVLFAHQTSYARFHEVGSVPVVLPQLASFDPVNRLLVLKGENLEPGATVELEGPAGAIDHGPILVVDSHQIRISDVVEADVVNGLDVKVTNPEGESSPMVHLDLLASTAALTESDIKLIIAQAVGQAEALGFKATIAIVDREGNVLGVFTMTDALADTTVGVGRSGGLESASVPASAAAVSKAGTGAFLSSQGHAFTTRTASFIVQEHFPPAVTFTPGGPLFGVQFSQLPCTDIKKPSLPLGLSADPGGVPIYKNGRLAGGIGIEGDGKYALDRDPADRDQAVEELVAVAATRGFEASPEIRGDRIIVNGIRFPFVNTALPQALTVRSFDELRGVVASPIRSALPSVFREVNFEGVQGRIDDRFFPAKAGSLLVASEVQRILVQAAKQAIITRAAIRLPLGSAAEVNTAVVDLDGTVLGFFSTSDAPMFGFDVSVQKARTAAFFSKASAGTDLRRAGFSGFVDAAAREGIRLDGAVAFSNRALGFLSRPFFPDGIDGSEQGPFSVPSSDFSPFNPGLQLDLVLGNLGLERCTDVPGLANGIQIFPGSVPLYKGGRLAGAIGVSGDGADQDDLIASAGSAGFEAPAELRADRFFVRGVRLPYVKFPRHPNR